MIGRSGMTDAENELLSRTVKESRIHVEVGCLWGASAIAAAKGGAKKIYTIDPMTGGWWDNEDPAVHLRPTRARVDENFKDYPQIQIVQGYSSPWPLKHVYPDSFLIDGDHSYEGAKTDWQLATRYTLQTILVHDYDDKHPGVQQFVDTIARKTVGWEFAEQVDSLIVFQRKSTPLVTVIVPTYNRPGMLERALKSISEQTFTNYEIVVVNDGGVDVSDIVRKFNARYIPLGRNWGCAGAKNVGLRAANGRYIAYLDDDDLYYPQHLEKLVSALKAGARLAYSDANVHDGPKDHLWFSRDANNVKEQNMAGVCNVMHERALAFEVGPYDETLHSHEDWDMWIRMREITPFVHIAEATTLVDRTSVSACSDRDTSGRGLLKQGRDVVYKRYHP